jgi:hypothetical protein
MTISTASLQKAFDYPAGCKRAGFALTGLADGRGISADDLRQNRFNIGSAVWKH